MRKQIYFVSGIDTGIGKSYVTGILAKEWHTAGIKTITQKMVQTGNSDLSEDIILHRKLMGIDFTEEDHLKLTMPEIFSYPASPHLAAHIDQRAIDFEKIKTATKILSERYDVVFIEGAGGLMVPLTEEYLIIDYIEEMQYPLIFVTSSQLGSINHTLLSLEAIKNRNISLHSVVYNRYPKVKDTTIQNDTERFFRNYLKIHFPKAGFTTL